jgi:hypothetical protein
MLRKYHNICGITEEELLATFDKKIDELAADNNITRDECIAKLKNMYDGYHFNEYAKEGIYNPFSVLNTLNNGDFRSYWFETGTPSYLVELLRRHHYNLEQMSKAEVTSDVLNCIDAESNDPIPVIYQSGYLTIKDYDPEYEIYTLGFPNEEVEKGFALLSQWRVNFSNATRTIEKYVIEEA